MATDNQPKLSWKDEKLLNERLQLTTARLEEAQQERIWAIGAAKVAGLSIRKIAAATNLSPTRVHQLLQDPEVDEIATWLSQLKHQDQHQAKPDDDQVALLAHRLEAEIEVLRWCLDWLDKHNRGERVVVNLVPDTDSGRNFVSFDLPRILRVLHRITADLDELRCNALSHSITLSEAKDKVVRHRERLAETELTPCRMSKREQLLAWHKKMKLPPHLIFGE